MANGVIDLQWKKDKGTRYHNARFYVFAEIDDFDILFGVEYLVREGLIRPAVMAPLVQHEKLTKGE
jgi:hypothetical protein